jgi:GxxExxY protein
MTGYLHEELTHELIGAFYEVYNTLGWGYLEKVYATAMAIELRHRGIRFRVESQMTVYYRQQIAGVFRVDMLVDERVVLEFKAQTRIVVADESQLLNYLRASGVEVGLVMNFGPKPERRRLIYTKDQRLLTDR